MREPLNLKLAGRRPVNQMPQHQSLWNCQYPLSHRPLSLKNSATHSIFLVHCHWEPRRLWDEKCPYLGLGVATYRDSTPPEGTEARRGRFGLETPKGLSSLPVLFGASCSVGTLHGAAASNLPCPMAFSAGPEQASSCTFKAQGG